MTKAQFKKQVRSLTKEEQKQVKHYYEELLKNAMFIGTFEEAEKCLLWIREMEEK